MFLYDYISKYTFNIHTNDTLLLFQSFFSISTNYSRIMWINAGDVHVFQSTVSQEKLHKFVQSFSASQMVDETKKCSEVCRV